MCLHSYNYDYDVMWPRPNIGDWKSTLSITNQIHTYIHTYLIDHSPLGLFRANETNNWNELNRLRIPTGWRQTSWLWTSAAEELNQGLPRTNPASGQSGTWTDKKTQKDKKTLMSRNAFNHARLILVNITKCPAKSKRKLPVCKFRVSVCIRMIFRLGLVLLFTSLQGL